MGLDTSLFIVLKEMSQDLRWTLFGVLLWKMLVGPANLLLVLDRLKKSKQGCVDLYNGTSRQTSKAITPSRLGHSFFSHSPTPFFKHASRHYLWKSNKAWLSSPKTSNYPPTGLLLCAKTYKESRARGGCTHWARRKKNNKNLSMHTESISVARSRLRVASVLFSHDLRWAWL